jgi:RNA polymerase sigma-70 factor (ECF subfamily)
MIAKNHCLMKLRNKNKNFVDLNEHMLATPDTEEMNLALEKNRNLNEVQEALTELNNDQQHCITLFYLQKRSYNDIAASTGFTLMQVKSHIQNGKRNLRLLLEKKIRNE